jgi:uncharacterized YccA/Bax inhibitor family protein
LSGVALLVLARVVYGRFVGGSFSAYVPAGGGYRGIFCFVLLCFVLDVFLCDPVFEDNGPDKRSITGNQRP